jgi:hypothetical protein
MTTGSMLPFTSVRKEFWLRRSAVNRVRWRYQSSACEPASTASPAVAVNRATSEPGTATTAARTAPIAASSTGTTTNPARPLCGAAGNAAAGCPRPGMVTILFSGGQAPGCSIVTVLSPDQGMPV